MRHVVAAARAVRFLLVYLWLISVETI